MNKVYLRLASFVLVIIGCTALGFADRGVVSAPMIGSANHNGFSVERVILSDSATVLDAIVYFKPGSWIGLAGSSSIVADGVTYPLVSARGIKTDERVMVPRSGIIHFSLVFPPVPESTRTIDFTEGLPSGWQLWDIDVTGKADHNANRTYVPAELQVNRTGHTLPAPVFAFGDSTTVRVHLLGYRPGMGDKLYYVLNTLHGQTGTDKPVPVDSLGNAVIRCSIAAPARMFLMNINDAVTLSASVRLAPGETVDLYADTHVSGIWNMIYRDGNANYTFPDGFVRCYASGIYREIDYNADRERERSMDLQSGKFGDYRMDADAYTDYIISQFKALADSVAADSLLSPMGRQFFITRLRAELIEAAQYPHLILGRNYRRVKRDRSNRIPKDSISVSYSDKNIRDIASFIDFSDPGLFFIDDKLAHLGVPSFWEMAGVDPGILKTVRAYNNAWAASGGAELTDSLVESLHALEPALAEEVVARQVASRARLDALDPSLVTATPDVPLDSIFDAIIAPHKGKVVMVDLWDTWCMPCRAALAANEPEKDDVLSSTDIVWIYLADDSSPESTYLTMISDIRGIHYYLTQEQINAIRSRFGVDSIPYYILVDRSGKAVGRPDLRDHSFFRNAILSALAQ